MAVITRLVQLCVSPTTYVWCLCLSLLSGAILPTLADGSVKLRKPRSPQLEPKFAEDQKRLVVVPSDDPAYLHCRIEDLGDHEFQVAWIRHKDSSVLTINEKPFTSDGRIQLSFKESEKDYVLWIKDVKTTDTGTYECQVSTDPPLSLVVQLNVIEYEAHLSGSKTVAAGHKIWLWCRIKVAHTYHNGLTMRWYHNNSLIIPNTPHKYHVIPSSYDEKTSELIGGIDILNAESRDAGEYSCRTPGAKQSLSVTVTGVTEAPIESRTNRKSEDESSRSAAMVKSRAIRTGAAWLLSLTLLTTTMSIAGL